MMDDNALAPVPTMKLDNLQVDNDAEYRKLNGTERAAVLLLALGEQYGEPIWKELDTMELKALSRTMSRLGPVNQVMVDDLLIDFVAKIASNGSMLGNIGTTERLLANFLDSETVNTIMEELRGPAGRDMWEKLSNVPEDVLANYLRNEYPQTVSVILSKLQADQTSKVLALLPEELSLDVMHRMLALEPVQNEVLERVEETLRLEFMNTLLNTQKRDPFEHMAEIFNAFDRQTEAKFLSYLAEENRDVAEQIKALMFTFDDLLNLDSPTIQTLLQSVDKKDLSLALKGASDIVREFFTSNMSARASKNLLEDMDAMGPVRLSEVDEAQSRMVNLAKDLAAKGDIIISKGASDEEMVA